MHEVRPLRNVRLGSAMVALVFAAGCGTTGNSASGGAGGAGGGSVSSSSSSSGMGGMSGDAGADAGDSGVSLSLPACPSGAARAFAVDQIFIGDTDADGTPNPMNGWKSFGFNLDGRLSTQMSTDLCRPKAGGSAATVYPDGNVGIDNGFGKNVLPILLGLAADVATVNNESIKIGEYTYLLSLANADQNACSTSSALLLGANLGDIPKFDGSDVWPLDPSSLVDPTKPASAKCKYADTTLEGGLVHAGPSAQLDFFLSIAGFRMVLPIRHAQMDFVLEPNLRGIKGGQIGGIIRTDDLVKEFSRVMGAFDASLCNAQSPKVKSILEQLRQASDIMQDGTQDPTKECDGISIGLGFTMKPVRLGAVARAAPPLPNPCVP